jgi:hypothetical protein
VITVMTWCFIMPHRITAQDRKGQDRTGQDRTGQDLALCVICYVMLRHGRMLITLTPYYAINTHHFLSPIFFLYFHTCLLSSPLLSSPYNTMSTGHLLESFYPRALSIRPVCLSLTSNNFLIHSILSIPHH